MAKITRGKNPYKSRGIPRKDILEAIDLMPSMRQSAEYLGVSYPTFCKYAKMYNVFKPLDSNKGITRSRKSHWTGFLQIGRPEHVNLLNSLLKSRKLQPICRRCKYAKQRKHDFKSPFILNFKNNDENDYDVDNLEVLCYNCYFLDWDRKRKFVHKRLKDDPDISKLIKDDEILNEPEITGDDLMNELGSTLIGLFGKN